MGRIIGFILMLVLVPSLCWGQMFGTVCKSSGAKTADGVIKASSGSLCGVIIATDGSNNPKVVIYDNPSAASGTKLFEMTVVAGDLRGGAIFSDMISASTGMYLDVTVGGGGSVDVIVYYR